MGKHVSRYSAEILSPSMIIGLVAAIAATVMFCVTLMLWAAFAGWDSLPSFFLTIPLLFVSAPLVAAATWAAAHRALGHEDSQLERLQTNVQCIESELDERQRAARAHAAIARLMGGAVQRLAVGDLTSRISIELPEPYSAFRDHFNETADAMQALHEQIAELTSAQTTPLARLEERAAEIGDAAQQLLSRAEKLAARLDADLAVIESGAERKTADALKLAQYTMGGARVAARRNMEAAIQFADLGRQVAEHARLLQGALMKAPEMPKATLAPPLLSGTTPATIGSTALKLIHSQD